MEKEESLEQNSTNTDSLGEDKKSDNPKNENQEKTENV